jgi:hypothetical protein
VSGRYDPNKDKHPFPGANSLCMNLLSSLTYFKFDETNEYFQTAEGKLSLGLILSYTKLDVENPALREWSLVVIRNLCSWSSEI